MGRRPPGRRGGSSRPARSNRVIGRPTGMRAAVDAKAPNRVAPRRCQSGFADLAIMPRHRRHMGSHSPRCQVRVLIPDGDVNASVLAELPLAKAFEILIKPRATVEHGLPQSAHHSNKNLVVSCVTNRQVESHALRGWRLPSVNKRFMCLKNRLKISDFSIRAPLASETGNLDLDDLACLEEIVRHALIDSSGKRGKAPLVRRGPGNENTLPMPDLDFSQQFEAMQCLTKSGSSDAQFRSKVTLRGNASAFRQAANDLQKPLGDNLGELRAHSFSENERITGMVRHIATRLASLSQAAQGRCSDDGQSR